MPGLCATVFGSLEGPGMMRVNVGRVGRQRRVAGGEVSMAFREVDGRSMSTSGSPLPVGAPTRPAQRWLLLLLFAAVLPNLVWIQLDKTVWWWDQAWYGKHSVELFFTLIYSPSEWLPAMLDAFGRQAPGIALSSWCAGPSPR